jgi:anaerobic ribonucleoside-triphosphate reductase activating protein
MRIHRIIPISKVNGPGLRFVIWVQGCSRHCPGCFNPATHSFKAGRELSIEHIIKNIPNKDINGITISGGEPFEQAEELVCLLKAAKEANLHRLVYTGFTYEELSEMDNEAVRQSLLLIDILIDGPFEQDNNPQMPWTGSGNQRIIILNNGSIEAFYSSEYNGDTEIIINKNGTVLVTGIFDGRELNDII